MFKIIFGTEHAESKYGSSSITIATYYRVAPVEDAPVFSTTEQDPESDSAGFWVTYEKQLGNETYDTEKDAWEALIDGLYQLGCAKDPEYLQINRSWGRNGVGTGVGRVDV